MSKRITNKRIVIIILFLVLVLILSFFFVLHYLFYGIKTRLLCETDHQALLEACNELSRQVAQGKLKSGKYEMIFNPDSEVSKFPQPILKLRPRYVYIDENDCGRVMIEMTGGLEIHFGVLAYTEDFKAPYKDFEYGNKELILRLWYYDDGYRDNPKYEKKIDALIQKGKKSNKVHQ